MDVETNSGIADKYRIHSIPTFLFFKSQVHEGPLVRGLEGAQDSVGLGFRVRLSVCSRDVLARSPGFYNSGMYRVISLMEKPQRAPSPLKEGIEYSLKSNIEA